MEQGGLVTNIMVPQVSGQEVAQVDTKAAQVEQSTTLTASECEVTNGFVKNGTSLPYIIETNSSGMFLEIILDYDFILSLFSRQQKTFFQNLTGVWHLW